jgi:polyhydroxyalkanoate synthesis regulator phasin
MKKTTRREALGRRLERVRMEAERTIGRGYRATLELLPVGPRKAVKELASQVEAASEDLTKRGQKALKAVVKQRKTLLGRVEKAVRALERRRDRAVATVERQGTKLAATFEERAAQAIKPVVRRLDIATASDVERLSKRLTQLERKLAISARRAAA